MKKTKYTLKLFVILPAVFLLFSCNPIGDDSQSNTILYVLNITGTDISGSKVNYLQSDVVSSTGIITADSAIATLKANLLEPASLFGASQYNDIKLTRYTVSYVRSDGNNVEGTDIPYSFEGYLSRLIEIDSSVDVSFIIVREVSKLELPLINLHEGRSEGVIEVKTKIDFYGQDMSNNTVKATGYLTIFFANYAD